MSWSSSKGRIRGKIASGGFAQPDNTLADAIDTGAGIMAKGIMERAEEERAEKKRAKAAAAAEARRLAAAQRKKEEEALKTERQVRAISARLGIDADNTEASDYIRSQFEAFGPSAAALIDADFKDGKIKLPINDITAEMQGPDVAPDFKVSVDGVDAPVAVDDLEAISTEMLLPQETRDSAREQMAITAPVSEIEPEVVGQEQGFVVDPTAKKVEIDWMSISDEQDVKTLQRLHDSGKQVLSEEDLVILKSFKDDFEAARQKQLVAENREFNQSLLGKSEEELRAITTAGDDVYSPEQRELAQGVLSSMDARIAETQAQEDSEEALEFRRSLATMDAEDLKGIVASPDYTPEEKASAKAQLAARPGEPFDLTDYDDVKTETLQTIIDDPNTDPRKVTQLEALVNNRNNAAPKVDPKSSDYLITYVDEAGEQQATVAKLAADGSGFVDLTSNKPVQPVEGTQPLNLALQGEMYDNVVKINTSLIKPLKEQRLAMVTSLDAAVKLDKLAEENPEILTVVGGKLPGLLKRVGVETKAFVDIVKGGGSVDEALSAIDQRFNEYINNSPLGETARAAALFQAEKVKMAFMFAASSLGQSGQGLSDKDFQRALAILDQGSTYETFTKNLRSQMRSVIFRTDTMISDFNEDASVNLLRTLPGSEQVLAGYNQNAQTYAASRNLGDAFTWAQGQDAAVIIPSAGTKENPIPVSGPDEARTYPPGTVVKAPDGKLFTVPEKAD